MAVSSTVNGEEFIGDTEVGSFQSMSIIGSDASCDSASPAEALPTIQLSFDNTTGGNWDDRELIKVYDAAMSEFHVSAARRVIVRILIVLADWVSLGSSSWTRILAGQGHCRSGRGQCTARLTRLRYGVSLVPGAEERTDLDG